MQADTGQGETRVAFVAVLLPAAALIITCLFVLEVLKYRSGLAVISPRRFRLRFAAWLLALLLCFTVFVAMFVIPSSFVARHPGVVLGLWTLGLVTGVALIWIMLVDIQEVEDRIKQRESEIWRDFARMLASGGEKPREPENPEQPKA